MIANAGLLLAKLHFLPDGPCAETHGLYALTRGLIQLCPNFFGKGPDAPPTCPEWVLTHEYFHPLGMWHGEYPGTLRMQPPGPDQAIQNANALASLAFGLANRDVKACNAPDSTEVGERADSHYRIQQWQVR